MYQQPKYAKRDHYSYHVANIPERNGNKLFIYFKRYTPKGKLQNLISDSSTLYEAFEKFKNADQKDLKQINDLDKIIPIARTLMVINFDHNFEEQKVKKWFQLIGKVRKIELGSYKNTNKSSEFKNVKHIYFAMVVFKNEFDMIKVFEEELLQTKLNEFFKFEKLKQADDDKGAYLQILLDKYETEQLNPEKQKQIDQLRSDGFQIVTDYKGDIDVPAKNKFQETEKEKEKQSKKKKILATYKDDFYKFQTNKRTLEDLYGADETSLTDKQYMRKKKLQLMEQFKSDQQKLKQQQESKEQQLLSIIQNGGEYSNDEEGEEEFVNSENE